MTNKVLHVVGARPNFMKVAPIISCMNNFPDLIEQKLVHTGQHYDDNLSKVFFQDLDLPEPDEYLNVGSGTHAEQTAKIMMAFEPVLLKYKPDWVLVVGDVNSTLACALVCSKYGVKIGHVEAGLRSGDRSMPEEINRLLTDQISDLLFTHSRGADLNLINEGISPEKIRFVGNVMIDTLIRMLPKATDRKILTEHGIEHKKYILVTLHRPSNVDVPETFEEILCALSVLSHKYTVLFPVHPRTRLKVASVNLKENISKIRFIDPVGYLDFLTLMNSAALTLTDSGGIQEETTYLGVPCLTLRQNTERPVTIEIGTNQLVESCSDSIVEAVESKISGYDTSSSIPELWDGYAAHRIVEEFLSFNGKIIQ
jgi:UDP-N-acetylglucosamine 2-epimerase (non-hydrolysing)